MASGRFIIDIFIAGGVTFSLGYPQVSTIAVLGKYGLYIQGRDNKVASNRDEPQ